MDALDILTQVYTNINDIIQGNRRKKSYNMNMHIRMHFSMLYPADKLTLILLQNIYILSNLVAIGIKFLHLIFYSIYRSLTLEIHCSSLTNNTKG